MLTHMDVGNGELCREHSRPTYRDVGSGELCREHSRRIIHALELKSARRQPHE
jgi:hypothetical protein